MNPQTQPHYVHIVDSASTDELKLALLRAIDHARKSAAEIEEYKARLDGALGTINERNFEIAQLMERLERAPIETS